MTGKRRWDDVTGVPESKKAVSIAGFPLRTINFSIALYRFEEVFFVVAFV